MTAVKRQKIHPTKVHARFFAPNEKIENLILYNELERGAKCISSDFDKSHRFENLHKYRNSINCKFGCEEKGYDLAFISPRSCHCTNITIDGDTLKSIRLEELNKDKYCEPCPDESSQRCGYYETLPLVTTSRKHYQLISVHDTKESAINTKSFQYFQ